ncbi:Guanine nucleotide-binding protein subunit gamma [Lachancea thermotolerans]|uniref:Guanine nucleotide-binding protein subunit gamma n=1 Tax=Lachancea thermotolerans (strain ATCC 56472 / CBS 6340 / NRRL Y-8284) TaxID=559295 RepID=C5DKU8_LACTC|nr:KLTH0F07678p [Lachancea thermotolerans CBS 6340]CAR24099.1 KLTH0F07678p [Lachancea thermotolerans CBS 6340]
MGEQDLPLKIQYLKLKRINELNKKLKEELVRERITASNACLSIIDYATSHEDYALPEIWGYPAPGSNPHRANAQKIHKSARTGSSSDNGCCVIV